MGKQTIRNIPKNKISASKVVTIDDFNFAVEMGIAYMAMDNTANIGAETTPADTIEMYFTTPAATAKEIVAVFEGFCSTAAAVFVIREGYSAGGGASGDAVSAINLNRASINTSTLTIKKQADTITSGGTVLHTEILEAGKKSGDSTMDMGYKWILAPATTYSVSIYLAAAGVADIVTYWIER